MEKAKKAMLALPKFVDKESRAFVSCVESVSVKMCIEIWWRSGVSSRQAGP